MRTNFSRHLANAGLALRYATLALEGKDTKEPKPALNVKPAAFADRPPKAQRTPRKAAARPSKAQSGSGREAPVRNRAAERDRRSAVLSSPEAAGRMALARSLLADTDESAEKICSLLLASPVTSAADVARDQAAQFLQVQRKAAGADAPPLSGLAAQMVRAYNRAVGTSR